MVKLFSAQSLVGMPGREGIILCHWFCIERDQPVAPYEELLANYRDLESPEQDYVEVAVDELFTAEEIDAMRAFLEERFGEGELTTREFSVPIEDIRRTYVPFSLKIRGETKHGDFVSLYQGDRNPLPIEVWGYLDAQPETR